MPCVGLDIEILTDLPDKIPPWLSDCIARDAQALKSRQRVA
jgi:hypothetical protein